MQEGPLRSDGTIKLGVSKEGVRKQKNHASVRKWRVGSLPMLRERELYTACAAD
jgi:hypothetical protein